MAVGLVRILGVLTTARRRGLTKAVKKCIKGNLLKTIKLSTLTWRERIKNYQFSTLQFSKAKFKRKTNKIVYPAAFQKYLVICTVIYFW
jgi:hypothetical protein